MTLTAERTESLSIADIARGIFRRKLLVASCLGLGLLGGIGIVAVNAPRYASEARVIITNLSTPYDNTTGLQEPQRDPYDDRFVASQVAVMQSEDLARRVVKSLQLAGKGEFDSGKKAPGTIKSIAIALGFGTDPRGMSPEERAIERVTKQTTVYPVPESDVIAVRYSALDADTAAAVANALAETFVLSTRESQTGPNTRVRDWLAQQIAMLRDKVSKSQAAVQKYRIENGLIVGATVTLGQQEISELNSQITLAEASASEAEAKAQDIREMLQSTGSVDASADVLNSPVVQRLREQQVTASQKISQLSATYLPNHPKMIAAQRELTDVSNQIRREALKVVGSLQSQAKVARARADALRASLATSKGKEGEALQSDVRLKELQREADADRTLLETMLARYADANARQDLNVQPGYARIIQTASKAYTPYFPKVGPTVILSALAGLGLGLGLAFLMEVMRQSAIMASAARPTAPTRGTVRHPATSAAPAEVPDLDIAMPQFDFTAALAPQAAVTETVPKVVATWPSAPPMAMAFGELDSIAGQDLPGEPLSRVSAAMLEAAAASGSKTFCVASIGGSFDSAYFSVALARYLAASKVKTVVVDLVSSRPSSMDLMGLPEGPGLGELVMGRADVAKIILRDPKSAAQHIRFGQQPEAGVRGILTPRMAAVINSLAQVYDAIILNGGEASSATPDMLQGVGSVLFLAPQSRHRDASAAARSLAAKGIRQALFVKLEPRETLSSDLRAAG